MRFNCFLKYLSFGCVGLIIPVMAVATVLEKLYGSEFVREHIYVSIPVIALWGMVSFASLVYMLRMKLYKQPATFSLHLSLILILVGGLVTHLSGKQGKIHLRMEEEPTSEFKGEKDERMVMPFSVSLKEFNLDYYPGTFSPSDFVSRITINDHGESYQGIVSINNILTYKGYRFYQSGYDADREGSWISVSTDPYGIVVTYTGYVWLLLSILCFFFQRKTLFRSILKSQVLRKGLCLFIVTTAGFVFSYASPPTVPESVAKELGNLLIYYNGRIAPLNTFASDFTKKIYGKNSYEGLSSEQVVAGWLFYYDDWKKEPMIKIKGRKVKELLGYTSSHVSLIDFIGAAGFKLEEALRNPGENYNDVSLANEKFNLISSLVTGASLKIFPYKISGENQLIWYSLNDKPEEDMPFEQWLFIRNAMSLVAERIAMNDWKGACGLINKIRRYQETEGGNMLPDPNRVRMENFYNTHNYDAPFAMASITIGVILFFSFVFLFAAGKNVSSWIVWGGMVIIFLLFLYIGMQLSLRWFVSGHLPLSNGFETMLFMSFCCCFITLVSTHCYKLMLPFGFLMSGFTLLVAMMGESSPQITNLMPVLNSPVLSIHVMVIMMSYTLLSFTMLDGIAGLLFSNVRNSESKVAYLMDVSRVLLYPAVFLLALGIFVGAVWANVSWGRYWGWDPKEVWALITFLIYAMPLHANSLSWFRKPLFFHVYCILAFFSVVITYFGVNYFLGGMHSYA